MDQQEENRGRDGERGYLRVRGIKENRRGSCLRDTENGVPCSALQRGLQPAIFISEEFAVQIQVEGPVGGSDSGLNPQLTPGLVLLPWVRQQKPGQVRCCNYALNYSPYST